ncbi:MAG: hypothetical protein HQ539_03545 [Parcubacteria group bacterium]|nr:hypothetical protein [Parcubacteria group bacterium]
MKEKPENKSKHKKRTVLLLKDDQILIDKATKELEERGFNVWPTHSVEEALYYLDCGVGDNGGITIFLFKNNRDKLEDEETE